MRHSTSVREAFVAAGTALALAAACGETANSTGTTGGHAGAPPKAGAAGGSPVSGASGSLSGGGSSTGQGGLVPGAGSGSTPGGGNAGSSLGGGRIDGGAGEIGLASLGGAEAAGAGGDGAGPEPPEDAAWAHWPMPNWASSGLPNPPHYTDLGDGTVRDDVTGLVWQATQITGLDWSSAQTACSNGFRVPSIIELVSISNPETEHLDPILKLPSSTSRWSSTPVWAEPMRAWLSYSADSGTYPWQSEQKYPVACVTGGNTSREPHYGLTSVGSIAAVRDNWTGLVWQQSRSDTATTFDEAQRYCPALGSGFRAPSIKELQTLVDRRSRAPAIDLDYFPDTPDARFWSSTARTTLLGFLVELNYGSANTYSSTNLAYMRCVQ
jgi:Protein of unknown function (DUF1566)